jgi:hypothetical protein
MLKPEAPRLGSSLYTSTVATQSQKSAVCAQPEVDTDKEGSSDYWQRGMPAGLSRSPITTGPGWTHRWASSSLLSFREDNLLPGPFLLQAISVLLLDGYLAYSTKGCLPASPSMYASLAPPHRHRADRPPTQGCRQTQVRRLSKPRNECHPSRSPACDEYNVTQGHRSQHGSRSAQQASTL